MRLAGLSYLGDDFIGLREQSDGSFVGYSLYASGLLDPDHLIRFPTLASHSIPSGSPLDPKSLVLIANLFPERLQRFASIRAIVVPHVTGGPRPESGMTTKAVALLAIAPSSLALQISPSPRALDVLARLVQRVPCYSLNLGGRVEEIPTCINRLMDQI